MDISSMTVNIQTDSSWALTALAMTRMTSLTEIYLVYFVTNLAFALSLNSHLQIEIECVPILPHVLDSRTSTWCVRLLHMPRRIIMFLYLVTEIKKTLTHCKIGKLIAFHRDLTSKITVCLANTPQMQQPSPSFHPNLKSILWLAGGNSHG